MHEYYGKRVLVTGGLGFLGSNLAHALVGGGAAVTLLDVRLPDHGANDFNIQSIRSDVELLETDLRDAGAMARAVRGQDVIFNIAGQTSHVDSMVSPWLDNDINTRGHLVLLEACRAENPEVKIVYCGTRAQFGAPRYTPVDEACPPNPVDLYGANKLLGEYYHFLYQKICPLRPVSLRVNNTYGPRHQMRHAKFGVQNYLIRLAMEGKSIQVYGDGLQLRDFNYVDDVVAAFLLAGSREEAVGQAYNLGSGQPITFVDTVKAIIEAAGSGSYIHVSYPEDRAKIETGDYVADISKIRHGLGWEPKIKLTDGLAKTVEYYREFQPYYWETL